MEFIVRDFKNYLSIKQVDRKINGQEIGEYTEDLKNIS